VPLRKRSVQLSGHATSIALEPEFWAEVEKLAAGNGRTLAAFIAEVDRGRKGNLASALRLAVLAALKAARPPIGSGSPD
jgi:predicted DNA-binding ribbon-helix-helix protein